MKLDLCAPTERYLGGLTLYEMWDIWDLYIWLAVYLPILKKYESQWEGLSKIMEKWKMFQTTNQYIYIDIKGYLYI